jgi:hypothetical protein
MQRRPAKSAHISPPSRTSSMEDLTSPSDNKSLSRMQRRSLGLTNRVWAVLAAFITILVLTRLVLPSSSDAASHIARHKLIFSGGAGKNRPTNFLNATEEESPPFEFCPVFGPGDELADKYGSMALAQSRLHLGSGARVQRVVQKALLGLPVTFSVIGGSGIIQLLRCINQHSRIDGIQSQRAMAQETTRSAPHAIQLYSSNGGTLFSRTPPLRSRTVRCDSSTRGTSASAPPITYPTLRT